MNNNIMDVFFGLISLLLVLLGLSQSFGPSFIPLLSRLDLFLVIRDGMRAWRRSRERTWPTGSFIFCNCIAMHSNLSNEGMIELLTTLMFLRIPFLTSEPILLLFLDTTLSLLSRLCSALCFLVVPALILTSLVLHQGDHLANSITTTNDFFSFVTGQRAEFWTVFAIIAAAFAIAHQLLTLNVGLRKDVLVRRRLEAEENEEEEEGEEEQKEQRKINKIFTALSSPSYSKAHAPQTGSAEKKTGNRVISPRIAKEERSAYEQVFGVRERPIERYNEDRPIPGAMRRKTSTSPKKNSSSTASVAAAATPAYEEKAQSHTRLLRSSSTVERRGSTAKRRIKIDHYTAIGKLPEQMEGLHEANDETTPSKRRRRGK